MQPKFVTGDEFSCHRAHFLRHPRFPFTRPTSTGENPPFALETAGFRVEIPPNPDIIRSEGYPGEVTHKRMEMSGARRAAASATGGITARFCAPFLLVQPNRLPTHWPSPDSPVPTAPGQVHSEDRLQSTQPPRCPSPRPSETPRKLPAGRAPKAAAVAAGKGRPEEPLLAGPAPERRPKAALLLLGRPGPAEAFPEPSRRSF